MNLAFNKKQSDSRKDWLYKYNEKEILDSKEVEIPMDNSLTKNLFTFQIVIQNVL